MKAKKLMRWMLALTLTGVCAVVAVMTLDALTGAGATARPSATKPIVTPAVPIAPPATDPPSADLQVIGPTTETAMTMAGAVSPAVPAGSPDAARPGGDDGVMLAAAPPVPGGEGRLLEQIETARAGLVAAQTTVPARPAGRTAWLPVVFLAGGGGLIGCALGLGLGSLFLRRRASMRTVGTSAPAAAPSAVSSQESHPMTVARDDSAEAVVRAARAELAARAIWDRGGSPAESAGPAIASSTGPETLPVRPHHSSFFNISPRRKKAMDQVDPADAGVAGLAPAVPAAGTARAMDAQDGFPMRQEGADPVDRRIAALERSLLQVVRAMEEVAERVTDREATSVQPRHGARARPQDAGEDLPGLGQAGSLAPRRHREADEDSEYDDLAPPMRAPRRHEREARPRIAVSLSPIAAPRPLTPAAAGPAAAPARPAPSVVRAVRALRAARDQVPAVPEPWDLSPAASAPRGPATPVRREPAPSAPSASTADGRDLVRIRRAALRLAAEGWDGGRIADQLRLGEGDVALIVKTAGAEQRLQPAGHGR